MERGKVSSAGGGFLKVSSVAERGVRTPPGRNVTLDVQR